jgi:hypothetical protein
MSFIKSVRLWFSVNYLVAMAKKTDVEKLLDKHDNLTHSEELVVISHVQRKDDDWFLNTLLVEGTDVPFKFRRRKVYKNLTSARVNLTYYPMTEEIAGMEFEAMKVVRIKVC